MQHRQLSSETTHYETDSTVTRRRHRADNHHAPENSGTTGRVGWTNLSDHSAPPEAAAAADELPMSAATPEVGGLAIPAELPDSEVPLFGATTSVIRLL